MLNIKPAIFALLTLFTVNVFCQTRPNGLFKVSLQSAPDSADCFIDSVYQGKTPLDIKLPAEPALLEFRHTGFANRKQTVYVASDTTIKAELSRPSSLKVTSNPPKATVFFE